MVPDTDTLHMDILTDVLTLTMPDTDTRWGHHTQAYVS